MSPLKTTPNGRNVHLVIQRQDGQQYVVQDRHFEERRMSHADLRWSEKTADQAAARAIARLSHDVSPDDYEVYDARGLTPLPNYFVVWFASDELFENCSALWHDNLIPAHEVDNLTPRKQAGLAFVRAKALERLSERFDRAA
jgi:hypothetical protein